MKNDHRTGDWSNQGFNEIQTRDLRDTGAMLGQVNTLCESKFSIQSTENLVNHF